MMRPKYYVALFVGVVLLIIAVAKYNPHQVIQPQSKSTPVLNLTEQIAVGATNKYSPLGGDHR